jgi:type II secretory pathway pseudopilin PulG
MKSQKGSVTVIALIMLLFLVILCGGWIIMMTQEKTNALSDAKQQQAWYAAEAGYKRAAVLLGQKEDTWEWTNNDASTFNKGTFDKKVDMKTLQVSGSDLKDTADNPWYAVNVAEITTEKYTSYPSSGSQTYSITSVGEYMGERKIIKRTVKISTNGGPTPTTPIVSPTKVAGEGVINAMNIDLSASGGGSNLHGELYYEGSEVHHQSWSGDTSTTDHLHQTTSGYSSTYFTNIPTSYFKSESAVIAAGATHYVSLWGNQYNTSIVENGVYYIDKSSVPKDDGITDSGNSIGVNIAGNNQGTGISGVTIYVYDGMESRIQNIVGPKSTNSVPVTIIVVNSSATSMNVTTAGRVRMLFASDITFSGGSKGGYFMAMTNGAMNYIGQETNCALLTANGDILLSGGNFTGQVVSRGTVTVKGQVTTYDASILNDKLFWLTEWSSS